MCDLQTEDNEKYYTRNIKTTRAVWQGRLHSLQNRLRIYHAMSEAVSLRNDNVNLPNLPSAPGSHFENRLAMKATVPEMNKSKNEDSRG